MANYKNKKAFRSAKRIANITVSAPLYVDGKAGRNLYDVADAIEILKSLEDDGIFSILSTPISMFKTDLYPDGPARKGTAVVGFIDHIDFDEDGNNPVVVAKFFPNFKDVVNSIADKDPVFHFRASARNNQISRFISFEYASKDSFNRTEKKSDVDESDEFPKNLPDNITDQTIFNDDCFCK